jgi:exopolysaccharide biosynthesis polyprenyl glycosylphosphotransferase
MLTFSDRYSIYRMMNIIVDAFIAFFSFLAAVITRSYLDTGRLVISERYGVFLWAALAAFFLWPFLLYINGLYPTDRLRSNRRVLIDIFKTSLQGGLFILAIIFIFKLHVMNRLILAEAIILSVLLLVLKEELVTIYIRHSRREGKHARNVLVVGDSARAYEIARIIEKNPFLGLNIVGLLVPSEDVMKCYIPDLKVLGKLADIEKVLHNNPVDHVIITVDKKDYHEVENIIYHCEEEGIEIWITADLFNITYAKLDSGNFFGVPMFVLRTTPKFSWQLFAKWVLDILVSLALSVITLPLVGAAALLIKLSSPGPVLFKQTRCGLHGRPFTLYKLRTMRVGAQDMLKDLIGSNIMEGPAFKMEHDPRITPVGRWLRKMSIDELPQFWNVLKNDMSLVGPRPPLPDEVVKYKPWQRRRLSMKPGITGLWQVSGRNAVTSFDKLAALDLEYIDKWSLALDIRIAFKTMIVVLLGTGK